MAGRAAFTYAKTIRDRDAFRVEEWVAVFDIEQKKDVLNMLLYSTRKPNPTWIGELPECELALSPDGKRLAVLRDSTLRYFTVN
ncbi:MAG TPA: hypothetical protein VGR73_00190 [Bryobacteraceae bacterium]|nr:hypothetical protein [Bryobacteraceae bacterium]